MPDHRLSRLAKGTPSESRLSIGPLVWGKTVSCMLCAGQSKGAVKTRKLLFGILLRPRYKFPEFFAIAPVLTSTLTVCRRNRGDPSSLRVRYKYYKKHSRFDLASGLLGLGLGLEAKFSGLGLGLGLETSGLGLGL